MMEPLQGFHDLICTISGISTLTADVIVAEIGADMSRFPTRQSPGIMGRHHAGEQRVR
jgi:transposase